MMKMTPHIQKIIKGKNFIGQGGTRAVYDLGNGCIIKIAKSQKGILCNKMEVSLYTTSSTTLQKYLAPILDYDKKYRWIIMKKYTRRFPLDSSTYRKQHKKIVKKFLDHGILPSKGVADYHKPYAPNLRLKKDKQIVIIDYGGFKFVPNLKNIS